MYQLIYELVVSSVLGERVAHCFGQITSTDSVSIKTGIDNLFYADIIKFANEITFNL